MEFVALAEETGLIMPMGGRAIRRARAVAVKWPGEIRVAINPSPAQLRDMSLITVIVDGLRLSGLPPGRLELEITEGHARLSTRNIATLKRLRELGARVALGFWHGIFRPFPFDKAKIDPSFARGCGRVRTAARSSEPRSGSARTWAARPPRASRRPSNLDASSTRAARKSAGISSARRGGTSAP
jgi:EAL domain-containing protein (putative c-di-GMP-specific phosphodiesterase class I)